MAAPKTKPTKLQQDQTRAAIQTTQLVKRLQCYALEMPDEQGIIPDLDTNRIKAITSLLAKTLPDLKAVEHTGTGANGEIEHVHKGEAVAKVAAFLATIAERSADDS